MKIAVIGMGYVGVPLAALLADVEGFEVYGVQRSSDRSGWKIDLLNRGVSPYALEPELGGLLSRVVHNRCFHVSDSYDVCGDADCVIVTVQTPIDEAKRPVMENLKQIFGEVGSRLRDGGLVSLVSTVPPGTTEGTVKLILEKTSGLEAGKGFNLVYSYERTTPGRLIHNIRHLPRVVGGLTQECIRRGVALFETICVAGVQGTDCLTAETAKLIENTYRDVNIAFANEAALICESLGADYYRVRDLVNSLPFIGDDPHLNPFRDLHFPGAGVGGHCLPKDPWLLLHGLECKGAVSLAPSLISVARRVNDAMPSHMRRLIVEALGERGLGLRSSRIVLLGLAFKEETEDARNSPTIALYDLLAGEAEEVVVHDPYVERSDAVTLYGDLGDAVRGRQCVVLMTRHREYGALDLGWLRGLMETPVVVDGRNVFDPTECRAAGFTYRGVGHPSE